MDQARNLIVANSDAVIAVGGGAGTLTEIAYAWSLKRPIVAFDLPGWSSALADKRIDERTRYPEIPEDKIYEVSDCDEALNILKQYMPKYNRRHIAIKVK